MDRNPIVEIREPGRGVRRLVLDHPIEVGRECDGENLADAGVSRRHLRLVPTPMGLSLVDLESRNGTLRNGVKVTGRVVLEPGDVVRLGGSEIIMVGRTERVAAPVRATSLVSGVDLLPPPPPPAPVAPPQRSAAAVLADRVLGRLPREGEPLFPAFTEMRTRVPIGVWHAVRVGSILIYVALCVALFVAPSVGLFWFFGVIVPLLPILFFAAPGLWRNICPLAASNQTPRVLKFTRAGTPPEWLRRRGYLVAITLFFGITGARLAIFNVSGPATGILLSITIVNALFAGFLFKGKSGWCSSICPLLPLQRVYGQTPFAKVPNSHCQPCVACTKNCYDFQPAAAYQADLHEPDPEWTAPRRLFVGALPGFVLGFFLLVGQHSLPLGQVYGQLALFFLGSVGLFFAARPSSPTGRRSSSRSGPPSRSTPSTGSPGRSWPRRSPRSPGCRPPGCAGRSSWRWRCCPWCGSRGRRSRHASTRPRSGPWSAGRCRWSRSPDPRRPRRRPPRRGTTRAASRSR